MGLHLLQRPPWLGGALLIEDNFKPSEHVMLTDCSFEFNSDKSRSPGPAFICGLTGEFIELHGCGSYNFQLDAAISSRTIPVYRADGVASSFGLPGSLLIWGFRFAGEIDNYPAFKSGRVN